MGGQQRVDSGESSLQFLGATGTVTGSKYLVRHRNQSILLDCGLFQGLKQLRERNWRRFAVGIETISAVVLSHAHIDHCGYLPVLARNGFRGKIYCTPATADLLPVMLMDSARLQEEDAEQANRHGYSKHQPALPLYTTEDVEATIRLVQARPYHEPFAVVDQLQCIYRRTGHILGAASIELQLGPNGPPRCVFSGDLGRWDRPILRDPELVPEADVILVESTYGDRNHPPDATGELAKIVTEAAGRGGALVVPAFAVGRIQELIWTLRKLEDEKRIPILPVYIDSPMAIEVTELYCKHSEEHDLEMSALMDRDRCPLRTHKLEWTRSREDSKKLNDLRGPMIIISASGMATGGRILHHLAHRLPDATTTVLLVGFQAEDTRGRKLLEGAKWLKILGHDVPVRAQVRKLNSMSGHADRDELLRWLGGFRRTPTRCYLVHGEPRASAALAQAIKAKLGWTATLPKDGEVVPLTSAIPP